MKIEKSIILFTGFRGNLIMDNEERQNSVLLSCLGFEETACVVYLDFVCKL